MVKAFAQLRRTDARLVIAGNDMGAEGRTRAVARDCGVTQRTVFTGLLREADRLELLADADVVVYPSSDEIIGLVPLEALLSGTPVVVADDSGCAEVVAVTGGGQVTPLGDARAIARAIERVLEAPAMWQERVTQATGYIRNTYGGPAVSAQLEGLYEETRQAAA